MQADIESGFPLEILDTQQPDELIPRVRRDTRSTHSVRLVCNDKEGEPDEKPVHPAL